MKIYYVNSNNNNNSPIQDFVHPDDHTSHVYSTYSTLLMENVMLRYVMLITIAIFQHFPVLFILQ